MKIIVGSIITEKVGYTEENIREGRSIRTRKEVVECAYDMV